MRVGNSLGKLIMYTVNLYYRTQKFSSQETKIWGTGFSAGNVQKNSLLTPYIFIFQFYFPVCSFLYGVPANCVPWLYLIFSWIVIKLLAFIWHSTSSTLHIGDAQETLNNEWINQFSFHFSPALCVRKILSWRQI